MASKIGQQLKYATIVLAKVATNFITLLASFACLPLACHRVQVRHIPMPHVRLCSAYPHSRYLVVKVN